MEFEDLGKHCQYENCNQKDFLPFHCNSCKKMLCLLHRSVTMHQCANIAIKDITSIDCPICNNFIKFDKSQDPNVIWDDHYMNKCSQQPSKETSRIPIKCSNISCRTILGPSNTLVCHQCHQKTCLTHRIPEEHLCSSLNKTKNYVSNKKDIINNTHSTTFTTAGGVNKQNAINNQSNSNTTKKNTTISKTKKNNMKTNANDITNTLKGTIHRRIQDNSLSSTSSSADNSNLLLEQTTKKDEKNILDGYICPFCQIKSNSEIELIDHIEVFHSLDTGINSSTSNSNTISISTNSSSIGIQQNENTNIYSNNNNHKNINNNNNNKTSTQNRSYNESHYREVCPVCQLRFIDAISLVQHFESTHNNDNSNTNHNRNNNSNYNNNNSSNENNNNSTYGKQCKLS